MPRLVNIFSARLVTCALTAELASVLKTSNDLCSSRPVLPTSSYSCMPQGLYLIISIFWYYFADILSILISNITPFRVIQLFVFVFGRIVWNHYSVHPYPVCLTMSWHCWLGGGKGIRTAKFKLSPNVHFARPGISGAALEKSDS